jgi:hypothetical protein
MTDCLSRCLRRNRWLCELDDTHVDVEDSSPPAARPDRPAPNHLSKAYALHKGAPKRTCAVCLEAMLATERVRTLPCMHTYHAHCIENWLRSPWCTYKTCPECCTSIAPPASCLEPE